MLLVVNLIVSTYMNPIALHKETNTKIHWGYYGGCAIYFNPQYIMSKVYAVGYDFFFGIVCI